MPFSRYQIRNEFSLADPELYKAADKDDPEALLEGVAMAGLVGVLRQLGDLAEFAAEIFHDLHEEVMVTATRGHGLLVRVQQLESDFPSIERAFLSQTGHSAFFSSSGVGWHPNLRMEQNLITRGDLPRFVMDSYEECRAPPRLFLLDKFDIAGAGACLKRYTDPSFYKVESYEMLSTETQRDKKTRKTKKKGSQWKNGNTPEPFQPSHVKLHQLLLEERIQNGTSEPARRVKLKKRKSKFPFDMENGKGYMEKLLSSPPEDKLVREVPLRLHTDNSYEPGIETFEISTVDHPPLGLTLTTENRTPYESPSVDKMVSREHMDNLPENEPETSESEIPTSGGARFETEDVEVEEKHISVNGIEDGYESDGVASEIDDYEDALATMESEIETDAELRANSDPSNHSGKQETSSDANIEQVRSESSGSESGSDDESSLIRKKITSFSYSDDTTTTSVDSSQAFACIEIPFRPRVSATDADSSTSKEANFKGSSSKDSDSSEIPSNNCVDVNNPKKTEELLTEPEAIIASTSEPCEQDKDDSNSNSTLVISHEEEQSLGPFLEEPDICETDMKPNEASINGDAFSSSFPCEQDKDVSNSDSTLVISHEEEQPLGPFLEEFDIYEADMKLNEATSINGDVYSSPKEQLTDDLLECKSDSLEAGISYSGENETEFEDRKTESVESESNEDDLYNLEEKPELKDREPELGNSESKDVDFSENKDLFTSENPELEGKEVEEAESVTFGVEKNEEHGLSTAELVMDESEVVQYSNESVEKNVENGLSTAELVIDESEKNEENSLSTAELVIDESEVNQNSNESVEKNEENGLSNAELGIDESEVVQNSNESVEKNEENSLSTAELVIDESEVVQSSNESVEKNEENGLSSAEVVMDDSEVVQNSIESDEKKESSEISVISPELDSIPSYDHSDIQYLDGIHNSSSATSIELNVNDVYNPYAEKESTESSEKESSEQPVISPELDFVPFASYDDTNIQDLNENHVGDPSANFKILQDETLFATEKSDQNGLHTDVSPDSDLRPDDHELIDQPNPHFLESAPNSPELKSIEQHVESESVNEKVIVEEKVNQPHIQSFLHFESMESQKNINQETPFETRSEKVEKFQDSIEPVSEEPSVLSLPQSDTHINLSDQIDYPSGPVFSGYTMLTQSAPINLDEMPPLPPLPPMQWRMGKPQNGSLTSKPDGGQHEVNPFPSIFPQIKSHPSLDSNQKTANEKAEYEKLPAESSSHIEKDDNSVVSSEVKISEQIVPQPPFNGDRSQNVSTSGREIFWPSSGSSLPSVDDADERPNGIRPMKVQRSRTPLIDAVAAHDKSKLRKVSERAMPVIPKEEEKDTLLEQIRAKSFNLKPAVQTRPSIQGPTTNLRVAAILEKANAIRQAFAGSDDDDDDEDGDDDWSDS